MLFRGIETNKQKQSTERVENDCFREQGLVEEVGQEIAFFGGGGEACTNLIGYLVFKIIYRHN